MGKNRCYGCEYFDGSSGCIVRCELGHKGILLKDGCYDYKPDITANCSMCFYNKKYNSYENIECSIHGYIGYSKEYCQDHVLREEDCKKSKKGCFVTTAICEVLEKSDHCYELEKLRDFRDNVLLQNTLYKNKVEEYYQISPSLIKKILIQKNKKDFCLYLVNNFLNPMINNINKYQTSEAVKKYESMVKFIKEDKWVTIQQLKR